MFKALASMVEPLRSQPLALALVVVNLLFLIGFAIMLREIGQSAARRDQMLATLTERCLLQK